MRIDTCVAEATGYLDRRRDDPPSTDSLTQSWVRNHAAENDNASLSDQLFTEEVDHVADEFAAMSATGGYRGPDPNMNPSASTFLKPAHLSWKPGRQQSMFVMNEQRFVSQDNVHSYTQPSSHGGFQNLQFSNPSFASSNIPSVPATSFAVSAAAAGTRATPSVRGGFNQRDHTSMPSLHYQHNTQPARNSSQSQFGGVRNQVDSWIDVLNVNDVEIMPNRNHIDENNIAMGFFIQQSLPRMDVPVFDGSPFMWVEFITKFRDLIHDQPYLNVLRKSALLLQHLKGEPKQSVQGYPNNASGYVSSLKRLKFLFGQKGKIAQATIMNITQGKDVPDHNASALSDLYYSVSNCLVTLTQLNYASDVYSSHTLRQVVLRLPRRLQDKWAETSFTIRSRGEDPNLIHFEKWLQARVMALKEN